MNPSNRFSDTQLDFVLDLVASRCYTTVFNDPEVTSFYYVDQDPTGSLELSVTDTASLY